MVRNGVHTPPGNIARHRGGGYPQAALDLAQLQSGAKRQAKHFADLSHGQSPVRHMPPPRRNESMECGTDGNEVVPRRPRPTGVSYPLVSLRRNRWSVWSGMAGQFASESVVNLLRNTQCLRILPSTSTHHRNRTDL